MLTAEELAPLLVECSEHDRLLGKQDILRHEASLNAERCLAIAELAADPRRVLEVGPGNLVMTTAFRAIFGESLEICVVEHPDAPNLDEPSFRERVERQKVDLRAADLRSDPVPFDGGFDAVLFCGVIEHLEPTGVLGILEQLRDQLADDGRLVIYSPNLAAFFRIASLAFGKGDVMAPPVTCGWGHGHLRFTHATTWSFCSTAPGCGSRSGAS